MAIDIQQDVFRLKVAISHKLNFVKIGQYKGNFSGIKLNRGEGKSASSPQIGEDLSTRGVVQEHVQGRVIREGGDERGDKGMPCHSGKNVSLIPNVLDLFQFDDIDLL